MKKIILLVAVTVFWAPLAKGQGFFSGDDPQLYLPNVFIIVDTSGSMTSGAYPGYMSPVTQSRNRGRSSIEVLTGSYLTNLTCAGGQKQNGILDLYAGRIRFGFGSFDDDGCQCCTNGGGNRSCWDYGDDTSTRKRYGLKNRCRGKNGECNGCWGKLIDIVDPNAPDDLIANNTRIQQEICNLQFPYCTPIGASLYDALYYFTRDPEVQQIFQNPQIRCADSFVLLFTDGMENSGRNSYGAGGEYGGPTQARALCDAGIPVFVVGFGDASLKAGLDAIAHAGTNSNCSPTVLDAFVTNNPSVLFLAFEGILDAILAGSSSRTEVASSPSLVSADKSYAYSASFDVSLEGGWIGSLKRTPLIDIGNDGIPDLDTSHELDFAHVLATQQSAADRKIYTVVENPRSWGLTYPDQMPRPVDENDAAVGLYPLKEGKPESDADMCVNPTSESICAASVMTDICTNWVNRQCGCANCDQCNCSAGYVCAEGFCMELFAPDPPDGCWVWADRYQLDCANMETVGECTSWINPDSSQLADYIRAYISGKPGTAMVGNRNVRSGPVLGDIFHSNPVVVPPPSSLAPNYKYEVFHVTYKDRPTMVYAGANDGMLHAFIGEDPSHPARDGRELWGFVPNNLLAKLQRLRHTHEFFVDGTATVRDVYFPSVQVRDRNGQPMTSGGRPIMGAYRTILVSGERGGGDAYFALDVTDPDNPRYLWEYRTDQPPMPNYDSVQCEEPRLETWARPIIGEVKVHNAHAGDMDPITGEPEPEYIFRPVVIVPGGYLPPQNILNIRSCIDFVEKISAAASLHVLDAETGRLLRVFKFSSSMDQDSQACLQTYYDQLRDHPDAEFPPHGSGNCNFQSTDWSGGQGHAWGDTKKASNDDGWFCWEHRDRTDTPSVFPDALLSSCLVTETDEFYRRDCCMQNGQGAPPDTCKYNATGWCHYTYVFFKENNSIIVQFKGDQCSNGSFKLEIGENFAVETVAASPIAYNDTLGEVISRTFVPTTAGKVWRIDMLDAEFDRDRPEGEMIYAYDVGGVPHDWDVGRDAQNKPIPWFDTLPYTRNKRRPITAEAALAMNFKHNLVLFFGTGSIDDIRYLPTQDYFFAVEETRSEDANTGFFVPDVQGKIFCSEQYGADCNGSGIPKQLGTAERLFGKPLVVSSKVFFSTFTPSNAECSAGTGRTYGYAFDDFNLEAIQVQEEEGIARPPQLMWTSRGPVAVAGTGEAIRVLTAGNREETIIIGAQVLHWGKVL